MRFAIPILAALCNSMLGATWYVSTTGSGDGSIGSPWPLQMALTNSSVSAGDVIMARAGIYTPTATNANSLNMLAWTVSRSGSAGNLITLKSYTNELAKIDMPWRFGNSDYWRFQNLEFYYTLRGVVPDVPAARPLGHFDDTRVLANHEWINCIIHDVNNVWSGAAGGAYIRGCIVWNTGNSTLEHVVYPTVQNFIGNIVGWPTAQVIELGYSGMTIRSNIMWGSGATIATYDKELLLATINATVTHNRIYSRSKGIYLNDTSSKTLTINSNTVSAVGPIYFTGAPTAEVLGNVFHMNYTASPVNVFERASSAGSWTVDFNAYSAASPQNVVFVDVATSRTFAQWQSATSLDANSTSADDSFPSDAAYVIPNQDEAKRAHIAVYNWTGADNVTVSMTGVMSTGDGYALYSAQNYNYGPIRTGTYNGTGISVPMTNLTAAAIVYSDPSWGLVNPSATSPQFAAFVVKSYIGTSSSSSLRVRNLIGR